MHEFEVLTLAQAARDKKNDELAEAMQRIFRVGQTEIVVDGAGRQMPVEIRYICTGSDAGYLRAMPVNGKRSRRSMRGIHWTQIERGECDE